MTTITADTAKRSLDLTRPVLWLFAAFMIILIVLPLSWLVLFAFTDKARRLTLQNFVTLFTDPAFLDPLLTTAIIATTSAVICCLVAAPIGWLVSRTDMPGRQTIRALVTASFVTPPFLPPSLQSARVFRLLRILPLIRAGLLARRLLTTEGLRDVGVLTSSRYWGVARPTRLSRPDRT